MLDFGGESSILCRLTDDRRTQSVNLIVATTNNKGPICVSVREAAKELIHKGKVSDGLLSTVEMFWRAYDPCLGCASQVLGRPTVVIDVRNLDGDLVRQLAG